MITEDLLTDYKVLARAEHDKDLGFYGYKTGMKIARIHNFSKRVLMPATVGSFLGLVLIALIVLLLRNPVLFSIIKPSLILFSTLFSITLTIEFLLYYRSKRIKKEDYRLTLSLRRLIALDTGNWKIAESARFSIVDDIKNSQRIAVQGFSSIYSSNNNREHSSLDHYDFYSDTKGVWHASKR